jgi:hypothetical protein
VPIVSIRAVHCRLDLNQLDRDIETTALIFKTGLPSPRQR